MKPGTIFATGVGTIEHPWFNNASLVSKGGTLEPDGYINEGKVDCYTRRNS